MRRHPQSQRLMAEINITPFTDVILVLLIVFMIITPLIYQSSINVSLPTASTKELSDHDKPVNITITREGVVYLGKDLVTRKELKHQLGILAKKDPNVNIVLFSDELVRYKEVVAVMDVLNELGIKSLNMATKVEK